MTKKLKIFGLVFLFVFRHKWDRPKDDLIARHQWKKYQLGFWFRKDLVVGKKEFSNPNKWGNNLVPSYMIGIHLIICKAWFTVSEDKTMSLEI